MDWRAKLERGKVNDRNSVELVTPVADRLLVPPGLLEKPVTWLQNSQVINS
jgi:hypothetical protein